MQRLLTVPEVAERFDVTAQTVRNWIAAGRLAAVQPTPRGRYRIPAGAMEAFEQSAGLEVKTGLGLARDVGSLVGTAARPGNLDTELAWVVSTIVASLRPDSVWLFGSRARGDAGPGSDFDLAVVVADGQSRRRIAMQAYESLAGAPARSVGVDIVVLTPSLIARDRDRPGSIGWAVLNHGISVFGPTSLD